MTCTTSTHAGHGSAASPAQSSTRWSWTSSSPSTSILASAPPTTPPAPPTSAPSPQPNQSQPTRSFLPRSRQHRCCRHRTRSLRRRQQHPARQHPPLLRASRWRRAVLAPEAAARSHPAQHGSVHDDSDSAEPAPAAAEQEAEADSEAAAAAGTGGAVRSDGSDPAEPAKAMWRRLRRMRLGQQRTRSASCANAHWRLPAAARPSTADAAATGSDRG
mmetsp:Transcript_8121/g.17387  ORF Transcript_8121/g.17387 Transcript_8121/m.17387 type:complete len:217 (-) Transcript_8121:176-826(-)